MMNAWLAGVLVFVIAATAASARAGSHNDVKADRWRIERPIVSNYWPMKGEPNTKVVIRGENFAADTSVVWGTTTISTVHVAPTEITFTVPKDAKSGRITLRHNGHSDLAVGTFEVAHLDPSDAKRADADREHAAESAWKDRQKAISKDRAARDKDLAKQEHDLEASRDQRREKEATEVRARWQQPALYDPDVQAELTLHAKRMADLERMDRLAAARADGKLDVRVQIAIAKENDRHQQRMTTLQNAVKK
jgi:hypothetical protein